MLKRPAKKNFFRPDRARLDTKTTEKWVTRNGSMLSKKGDAPPVTALLFHLLGTAELTPGGPPWVLQRQAVGDKLPNLNQVEYFRFNNHKSLKSSDAKIRPEAHFGSTWRQRRAGR